MPRPKTISDHVVLAAALEAMAQKGTAFTLADVGRAVGLSRATLIQRFGDRDRFLLRMAEHDVAETQKWLAGQPVETGEQAFWTFMEDIITGMGSGDSFAARIVIAALEARDPGLRSLAASRYGLVQDAIAERLPKGCDAVETAAHLHSVIAGATMQWIASSRCETLSTFVLRRVRWAIDRLSLWTS
jgi:TetR/AcrR family transcriptional regulator, macrolide resistance operon repressor